LEKFGVNNGNQGEGGIGMALTLIPLIFIMLIIGFPIFLTMIIPSFVAMFQIFPNYNSDILVQQMFGGVDTFSLLAIPFFMFAADIISNGQIGHRLVNLTHTMVGHLPGGLAMATVVACMFFGAISGAGSAAVVAIGGLVYSTMVNKGYKPGFAMGLILASSTLAMLIPPGIAMILYSTVNPAASVAQMFAGGLAAGLLAGVAFMLYSFIYAVWNKIPRDPFVGFRALIKAFYDARWALGLPILILVGIYSGITTATEAAAVAVAYALFVEMVVYRGIGLKELYRVSVRSGVTIAMLLVLIAVGKSFSYLLTMAGVPQMLTQLLGDFSPMMVLLLINVVFLIAGMFIDPNSAVIVLVPLIVPIAVALGLDPVHLGIVVVLNLSIGMITPPFGLNIFVAQGAFKIPYGKIVPGLFPFVLVSILVLLLVTYVPELVMWLPNLLK
jgi:C4-dicarboxylate transporter DctM subunit